MLKYFFCCSIVFITSYVNATPLSDYLEGDGTHASVTLDLPFEVIEANLKQLIKQSYSGKKANPTSALSSDELTWVASLTSLKAVKSQDGINISAIATGTARIKGKLVVAKVSVSTNLKATASVILKPKINTDWSISLNATGKASLTEAQLYGISIRSFLQNDLNKAFDKALTKASNKLSKPDHFKNWIRNFWESVCKLDTSQKGFATSPHTIALTQPTITELGLRITVIISGSISALPRNDNKCPELPNKLTIID